MKTIHQPKPTCGPLEANARCTPAIDPEARRAMIAESAYYRSLSHEDRAQHDIEDWLAAERAIDDKLRLTARFK